MAYDKTKTWADLEREVQNMSRSLLEQLQRAEEMYADLSAYKVRIGTNAQIATASGAPNTAAIDDLEVAVVALHRIFQAANGEAVTVRDYLDDLRMFT